jgi:hypothetical protein
MSLATDAREAIHHEYYRRWIVSVRGPTHGRPDAAPPRPLKAARRSLPLRAARTIVAVPALSMTPIRDRKVAFGRAALALRPAVAGTPTALAPLPKPDGLPGAGPAPCGAVACWARLRDDPFLWRRPAAVNLSGALEALRRPGGRTPKAL